MFVAVSEPGCRIAVEHAIVEKSTPDSAYHWVIEPKLSLKVMNPELPWWCRILAHIEYVGSNDPARFAEPLSDQDRHPYDRDAGCQISASSTFQGGVVECAMLHL
jgi:hypothetical protein